jgi:hypothetical protein
MSFDSLYRLTLNVPPFINGNCVYGIVTVVSDEALNYIVWVYNSLSLIDTANMYISFGFIALFIKNFI